MKKLLRVWIELKYYVNYQSYCDIKSFECETFAGK